MTSSTFPSGNYELRFRSLYRPGRGYVFPCDANGSVDLAALSAGLRAKYLEVRSVIGREFALPAILHCAGR